MIVLAFDCAGAGCRAALVDDGTVLARDGFAEERAHARLLIPMLDRLVRATGIGYSRLDRIAVTTGPGSFTGIRAGLAAARGLGLSTGRPVTGWSVFAALAAGEAPTPRAKLAVVVESGRDELFLQRFDEERRPLGDAELARPEGVAGRLDAHRWLLAGDGLARLPAGLTGRAGITLGTSVVDPVALARLAAHAPLSASPPSPLYLRRPDIGGTPGAALP